MALQPHKVIISGPRGDEYEQVLGTRCFVVHSPFPAKASLPGFDELQDVYMLDLQALGSDQLDMLCGHLARKFGIPKEEMKSEIAAHGVPILAKHCGVSMDLRYFT